MEFIPDTPENAQHKLRFHNGIKNNLDSQTFNAVLTIKFETHTSFISAIENIIIIFNDPSTVQMEIINRKQKQNETIMVYSNRLMELHNEYIMLYALKYPEESIIPIQKSNDLLLTQNFLRN